MAVAQRKPSTKSLVLDTMFLFSWLQWLCVYLAADGTSRHGGGLRNKNEVAANAATTGTIIIAAAA